MLIGLTGTRFVGKSETAKILVEKHGFTKIHPFGGGKVMCMAYAQHLGIDQETAYRLVYGDLKDVPHPLLPGDGLMRTMMEQIGYHMGVSMGPEYTLGAEIARNRRLQLHRRFIVESIVYEAPVLRNMGGVIIRVRRPEVDGKITGVRTDSAVASILEDYTIDNVGTIEDLENLIETLLADIGRKGGGYA